MRIYVDVSWGLVVQSKTVTDPERNKQRFGIDVGAVA